MTSLLVLAFPNFTLMFDITIDASSVVVGVVLSQVGHHVAFLSKGMCLCMCATLAYEWEMFVITSAVKKLRYNLLGLHFRLYWSIESKKIVGSNNSNTCRAKVAEQTTWLRLWDLLHLGCNTFLADALSHQPQPMKTLFVSISTFQHLFIHQLHKFY